MKKRLILGAVAFGLVISGYLWQQNEEQNSRASAPTSLENQAPSIDNTNDPNSPGVELNKSPKTTTVNKSRKPAMDAAPFVVTNRRPLTPAGDFMNPRWSPDGQDILYSGPKYQGLYLVGSDGSNIRQISNSQGVGYYARWSDDGSMIIIGQGGEERALDLTGDEVEIEPGDETIEAVYEQGDDIIFQDLNTGEKQLLTSGGDAFFSPHISPDENLIAYSGLSTGGHIKNMATGETINIGQGTNLQWLPNSEGLIFVQIQDDGHEVIGSDLYFASADGQTVVNITNTPRDIELNPAVSPDGSEVLFEVDGRIYIGSLN